MSDIQGIPEMLQRIAALEAELDHWKANHDNQVQRARILMERTDLPIERVEAYKRWQECEAELARANHNHAAAEAELKAVAEGYAAELANEKARDIHSCHDNCTRDGCVNRRLRDELAAAQATIAQMLADLGEVRRSLQFCNDSPGGGISDTLWMTHRPATIFDCIDEILALPSDRSALDAMLAPLQAFKNAVIDELVTCHILTAEHETNPRKALHDVITWNCQVALDPAVSSDAAKLVADAHAGGQRIMQERAAKACDAADKSTHPADLADAIRNLEIEE